MLLHINIYTWILHSLLIGRDQLMRIIYIYLPVVSISEHQNLLMYVLNSEHVRDDRFKMMSLDENIYLCEDKNGKIISL